MFHRGFVALREDDFLDHARVAIAKRTHRFPHYGVAGRPAVGSKIVDIQKVRGPHGAAGIAQVTLADIGVTFAFEENHRTPAVRLPSGHKWKQAASGHFRGRH
jgi:hypothetical protein